MKNFFVHLFILFCVYGVGLSARADDVAIDALVPGCGDGIVTVGEDCDLTNLDGKACSTIGFSNGTLSCTASCTFNTTQCASRSSGGGGGGGSSRSSEFSSAHIALSGGTAPLSEVVFLADGVFLASTSADEMGGFSTTLHTSGPGTYRFSVYATDVHEVTTKSLTFFLRVPSRGTVRVDNLFLAPTIQVDKKEVKKGNPLKVTGTALPSTLVEALISATSSVVYRATTTSDDSGGYTLTIPTEQFEYASHTVVTRTIFTGVYGDQSLTYTFVVGSRDILSEEVSSCTRKGDLNRDCKVNLVDFSIVLFWFKSTAVSSEFLELERTRLSGDGKVNITDVSIMFSFWTG